MSGAVLSRSYDLPQVSEKEALRYAGCRTDDGDVLELLRSSLAELEGKISGRVCWRELPLEITDNICDFGVFSVISSDLALNLRGCGRVVLFAATVGVEIDRLIARYSRISPAKALMLQALGAERIEALCDIFCDETAAEYRADTRPRFSPGYGDLPLETQRDIFRVLDCERRIGLTLNGSLLMSPGKSVTAFVGLRGRE